MTAKRKPAVAGLFYPAQPAVLRREVQALLAGAVRAAGPRPRALIVPHAGYIYSGPAAAQAYARLQPWRDTIKKIVLLGPPHRVPVRGIAASSADAFETPLGTVSLDRTAIDAIARNPCVTINDPAHAPEHSLEVQLPFLQTVLGAIEVVPLLVAASDTAQVSELLLPWWETADSLIVISTDLSHYLDHAAAVRRDAATDNAIMRLEHTLIGPEQACGCRALNGLLHLARARRAEIERLALCNSGDTAGSRDRVVGYAAYALY